MDSPILGNPNQRIGKLEIDTDFINSHYRRQGVVGSTHGNDYFVRRGNQS